MQLQQSKLHNRSGAAPRWVSSGIRRDVLNQCGRLLSRFEYTFLCVARSWPSCADDASGAYGEHAGIQDLVVRGRSTDDGVATSPDAR